jgi:hypothetical protein
VRARLGQHPARSGVDQTQAARGHSTTARVLLHPTRSKRAPRLDGRHHDQPVPHTIEYSVGDNRLDITLDDGAKSSLWWATKNEWLGLIDVAGLRVEALYGGFASEPFTDESLEYVFVARR